MASRGGLFLAFDWCSFLSLLNLSLAFLGYHFGVVAVHILQGITVWHASFWGRLAENSEICTKKSHYSIQVGTSPFTSTFEVFYLV